MGLMNTPAMRAHVMGLGPFLSVSMTSEITYEVSGGEVPVYSPKTAPVVLITAINLPLTYRDRTVPEPFYRGSIIYRCVASGTH